MDDANTKLDEMELELASGQYGNDLRHVKELLQKHQVKPGHWSIDLHIVVMANGLPKAHKGPPNAF